MTPSAHIRYSVATTRRIRSLMFVLIGTMARTVAAQTHWEAYIGLYRPTNTLASDSGRNEKHQNSVTLGLRVAKWWPSRWGVEITLGYAPSSLLSSYSARSGGPSAYAAHVVTASAQVRFRLTPTSERALLQVGGGVSLVGHGGGSAYPAGDYFGPRTFLGGVVSLAESIRMNSWLALRFDAEDYVYVSHLGACGLSEGGFGVCDVYSGVTYASTGSRLQNDLVLSLGFSMTVCPTPSCAPSGLLERLK